MPSSFAIRWSPKNPCVKCGKPLEVGQFATFSRRGKGMYMHVDCKGMAMPHSDAIEPDAINPAEPAPVQPAPVDVPTSTVSIAATGDGTNPFAVLAASIAPFIKVSNAEVKALENLMTETIAEFELKTNAALSDVAQQTASLVAAEVAKATRIVKVESKPGEFRTIEGAHKQVDRLLYYLSKGHHVYMSGPPGSGKSHAIAQLANAMQKPFGYISLNPQTAPSQLIGYMDANGKPVETEFSRMYRSGGYFCIDEGDNANDMLLTSMNSALANGTGAFPWGNVKQHPEFVCVVTGNTNGQGATRAFPTRRKLDVAFLDRFTFMQWEYDEQLERALSLGINPDCGSWVDWIQAARSYCASQVGTSLEQVFITPRASFRGAEYLLDSNMDCAEIADAVCFKGMKEEVVRRIINAVPFPTLRGKGLAK